MTKNVYLKCIPSLLVDNLIKSTKKIPIDTSQSKKFEQPVTTCEAAHPHHLSIKMQNLAIVNSHFVPICIGKIKKTDNTKFWQGYEATGSLKLCWWECEMVQPL